MAEAETEKPISERAATVPYSISHAITKDETLCTVAVGMLDSTKGEIFGAPIDIQSSFKETVVQFVKIVSEELGAGEHLAGNGNNSEAEDNKIVNACIETDMSNDNVMAKDDRSSVDESPSQDRPQQLSQSNNEVDVQVIFEESEIQAEERRDGVDGETVLENPERGDEDKHNNEDSEAGIFNDESATDVKLVQVTEPSSKEIKEEPLEIINKEDSDPAEGDKLESSVHAASKQTGIEKLQRDGAKQEIIAETEKYNDERRDTIGSVSELASTENSTTQEPLEILEKDDLERAEKPQKSKLDSFLDAAPMEEEEKKLRRVDEDQHVQIQAETGICDDKRNDDIGIVSVAEPSEMENADNVHEKMAKENLKHAIDELEHYKLQSSLDANPGEPEEEMPHKVIENKNVETEDEIRNSDDERSDKFQASTAEPSDSENSQGIPEVTAKEDNEEAEDKQEHINPESPPDAVPQEPKSTMLPHDGHECCELSKESETDNRNKEELTVNEEEISHEDEKKYEPTEKTEFKLLPVQKDVITEFRIETVTRDKTNKKNTDEKAIGISVAQEGDLETVGCKLPEITANEAMIHDTENNMEQIAKETEQDTLEESETLSEDHSNKNAADDGLSLDKETDTTCMPMVLMQENADNQIHAEETEEQSSERDDSNDSNERHTKTDLELTTAKDAAENENAENRYPKLEQTDEETAVMGLSMVQRDNGELHDESELIQEKHYSEVGADSVITLEKSSSDRGPNVQDERENLEDILNIDSTPMIKKPAISEQDNFTDVVDKNNHMEKQENSNKMDDVKSDCESTTTSSLNPSYEPDDKEEKVRDEDNQNDEVAEKHEEASNSFCEDRAHEIDNIKVSKKEEETSQDLKLVPELVCGSKTEEANTEIEDTQAKKPDLDEKDNSMTMELSDLSEENQEAKEESKDPNNSEMLKKMIQEEGGKHEGIIEPVSEGLHQNSSNMSLGADDSRNDLETANKGDRSLNDPDTRKGSLYEGTEADFQSASQSVSEEHCHDMMADLGTTGNDIDSPQKSVDKPIDSLSAPNDPNDDEREQTDREEPKMQISAATNGSESSGTKLVENDVHAKTEEKGHIEGEVTEGRNFHEEQMAGEKLDIDSELEHGESSGAVDETIEAVLQREKCDETPEEHSEVASGKTTAAEESIHTQDGKNPSAKHKECSIKNGMGLALNEAVTRTDMDDLIPRPECADNECKPDVIIEKPEETSNSACEEETQETITASIVIESNSQETELSPKLELVSNSEPEDKIKEIISQNDSPKTENVAYDCILKNMVCASTAPSDEIEDKENEANQDKNCDDSSDRHESAEVGQEKEGDSSSSNEELTDTQKKAEVDTPEEGNDLQFKLIPESLPEDRCQEETDESYDIETEKLTDDVGSKRMISGVSDLKEHVESTYENAQTNPLTEEVDPIESHTTIPLMLPEKISEYEDASETEHEEQICQAIDYKGIIEVGNHEEKATSEDPKSIVESESKDDKPGDITIGEQVSIDDSVHTCTLDKTILEIIDAPETRKNEYENVLKKDTGHVSYTQQPVVEGCYDGEGEKNENSPQIINTEDKNEDMMEENEEIPDIKSEAVPEGQSQNADGETEVEYAAKNDEAKCSVSAEIASDTPKGSNSQETAVGHGYILESDNKLENMVIKEDEVAEKEGPVEKTSGILTVVNSAQVTSEDQIEGKDVANIGASSELTACEEKQRLEEVIPEAANIDQHKERHNKDIDTEKETTTEENFQPSVETETFESQTLKDAYQVIEADARECQEASLDKNMQDASIEETEVKGLSMSDDNSIKERDISNSKDKEEQGIPRSLQKEEVKDKSQENEIEAQQKSDELSDAREESENESSKEKKTTENDSEKERLEVSEPCPMVVLCDLETRIGMEDTFQSQTNRQHTESDNEGNILNHGDMKFLESGNGLKHGNESNESTTITEGSTLTEEVKDVDDGMTKSKETATISDDSSPDISASNEETEKVENTHISAADLPSLEQLESNSLSKGVDDELTEPNTTENSEKDYVSTINKEDHEELSGKGSGENDKISEEDATADREASASSLLAQEVEGGELRKADELVPKEEYETNELAKNNKQITKKEEDLHTCLTESSKIGPSESTAADVESLPHNMTEEAEAPPSNTDEKGKDAVENMEDNLHFNKDSLDKDTQDACLVVSEESALGMSEDNIVEVCVTSNNENKEQQDVQKSSRKEELEDKQQKIEDELQPERKAEEARNAIDNNDNKSFKEKETTENDSKSEGPDPETSPHVVPKDLDTTNENEDTHRSEKAQDTENKQEDNFLKEEDIQVKHDNQSYKSTHAKKASNPSGEGMVEDVVRLDVQKGDNSEIVGDVSVTDDSVGESKDTEEEEPLLQMKSVEPETHEKTEQSDRSAAQNKEIADIEPLNIQLQRDTNELCQFEHCSNTMFECQVITDRVENIQKDTLSEENAVGSSHQQIWEDENLTEEIIENDTNLAPNDEESKNKQPATMSEDTSSGIPASNEEIRQVETMHEKAGELSYAEQVESTSLSKAVNLDMLTRPNTMEHLHRDYASMIDKQVHEERSGKEKCENDKISEDDRTNDGLLAQEAEKDERKADDFISEERQRTLDQEKNKREEIPKKEDVNKEIIKEAEVTSDTIDEKADDAELQSPADTETVGDNSHVSEASVDDNIHDTSEVVSEVEVLNLPEDKNIKLSTLLVNEKEEVKDMQTSLQKEELEDKPRERRNEIQTEQKSDGSRSVNESTENESFQKKDRRENDQRKVKLEELEQEKSCNVIPEELKTIGNKDPRESESKNQQEENKNEDGFPKVGDMKFVDSAIESEFNSQSGQPTHTDEGLILEEETLNTEDLIDDVAKTDPHNEEDKEKIVGDVCVTHDLVEKSEDMVEEESLLEKKSSEQETHKKTEHSDSNVAQEKKRADASNVELPKDTKEVMQLEECSYTSVKDQANIEKNTVYEEDAGGFSHDPIRKDGTRAKQCIGTDSESAHNYEMKEYNHQPSNESIMMMNQPDRLSTSSTMASLAEETEQELCENFSKISDYWPGRRNEQASLDSEIDMDNLKEMKSYSEQPDEAEKFTFKFAQSISVLEIDVKNEEGYVAEASRLDATDKEAKEEFKKTSDLRLKEVGRETGSSIKVTEDKENVYEESARQKQQVNQIEVVRGTEELTDEASHEVDFGNLQVEKQQMGVGELPVSQFLMKYILQEEGDAHKEALVEEHEEEKSGEDERNDVKIPKEEEAFAPLYSELLQAEGSIDQEENSAITVTKDDASLQSPFDNPTLRPERTEDRKEQITILLSETSSYATDDSTEPISTEQTISEVTVDNEKCCRKPDTAQDEIIHVTAIEETITEQAKKKDNGNVDKDTRASFFDEALGDNISQKGYVIESKERSSHAGHVESERQSTIDEYHHGEMLETNSEVMTGEYGEQKEDNGNQVQMLKNDSKEEPEQSELQDDSQSDLAVGSNVHALQIGEKVLDDTNSGNINDEQVVETMEANADENKNIEEEHETEEEEQYKAEKSSCIATTAETQDVELKSIQKCDQTTKSSKSSSTTDDHKLGDTSELQSEGSEEEMKLHWSQEEKQSAVANKSIIQPPEMAAKKLINDRSFDNSADKTKAMQRYTDIEEDKTDDEETEKEERITPTNEGGRDAEQKKTPKKSLGSKVKHTIAKVKKAIIGKSSHSKALSAK